MIPMVDLKIQYHQLKSEIDAALFEVLQNTAFILGPNVRSFEEETAAYLDVKYTVGCASGTDALHLALRASGIGPGDEVITTAFTFIATAEAIRYVGATPVFVDINNDTYTRCSRSGNHGEDPGYYSGTSIWSARRHGSPAKNSGSA